MTTMASDSRFRGSFQQGHIHKAKQHDLRSRMREAHVVLATLLVLLLLATTSHASTGDASLGFRSCVWKCILTSSCRDEASKQQWPSANSWHSSTALLRLLGWDCESDCDYTCQQQDTASKLEQGLPVEQYHGKWPFVRVAGVTELFSALFSIANAAPHFLLLSSVARRAAAAPSPHLLRPWVLMYAAVNAVAWALAVVYHTRSTRLTEAADYFSADLTIVMGLWLALVRLLAPNRLPSFYFSLATFCPTTFINSGGVATQGERLIWDTVRVVTLWIALVASGLCLGGLWLYHVHWMWTVTFDYGYNMKVALVLGVLHTLTWSVYLFSVRRDRPRIVALGAKLLLAVNVALSLELLDFPPLLGLLDAHALWHLATIPVSFLWYRFLRLDIRRDLEAIGVVLEDEVEGVHAAGKIEDKSKRQQPGLKAD